MCLTHQRSFTTPLPGEDWTDIVRRVRPGEDETVAADELRSWNLHLFLRRPSGRILGADVIFTEPPSGAR